MALLILKDSHLSHTVKKLIMRCFPCDEMAIPQALCLRKYPQINYLADKCKLVVLPSYPCSQNLAVTGINVIKAKKTRRGSKTQVRQSIDIYYRYASLIYVV